MRNLTKAGFHILPLCEQALDLPGCLEDNLQLERRAG